MIRLATVANGRRDGALVVVSSDLRRHARPPVPTLQAALDDWDAVAPSLAALGDRLDHGGDPLPVDQLLAPLPRAFQYCEGSTYLSHMERCRGARGAPLPPGHDRDPAVLLGASDRFLAPTEDIELAVPEWDLDLEVTVAAIVADVPRGVDPGTAAAAVRLLVLVNDLTLRSVLVEEAARGFGFFQAKPLRAFAPVAVAPEALGPAWDGRLLHARVRSWINDELLGALDTGADAAFDFGAVIAHAARTRPLAAGTIVGTGTVSNRDPARGFGCLAEKRALEIVEHGRPSTPYLTWGDRLRVDAHLGGGEPLFGAMDAQVIRPKER